MKKIILKLTAVILLISSAFAQARTINSLPVQVSSVFTKNHPAASLKKWTLQNDVYVLKYAENNKKHLAYYDAAGSWVKTETNYGFSFQMPDAVKQGWKKSAFISWNIESINELETPGVHQFVMTVTDIRSADLENRGSQRKFNLFFDINGEMVKKLEVHNN